jgi:hypothetical protein
MKDRPTFGRCQLVIAYRRIRSAEVNGLFRRC